MLVGFDKNNTMIIIIYFLRLKFKGMSCMAKEIKFFLYKDFIDNLNTVAATQPIGADIN